MLKLELSNWGAHKPNSIQNLAHFGPQLALSGKMVHFILVPLCVQNGALHPFTLCPYSVQHGALQPVVLPSVAGGTNYNHDCRWLCDPVPLNQQ